MIAYFLGCNLLLVTCYLYQYKKHYDKLTKEYSLLSTTQKLVNWIKCPFFDTTI